MTPPDWRAAPGGWEVGNGPVVRVLIPGVAGEVREMVHLARWCGPGTTRVLGLPEVEVDRLPALARLMEAHLPPEPVVVVGASFGGLVARAFTPGRVRSLVTVGTLPRRSPAADRAGRIGRLLPFLPDPVYTAWYRRHSDRAWAEDGAEPALVAAVRLPPRRVLAARLRAIAGWELPERVTAPTRMVWGATDPFAVWTVSDVEAIGAEGGVVPGGHRPHLSHPAEVARWW